jgi:hypothetical protein
MIQEGRSLSIHEGNMNSLFAISVHEDDSAFEREIAEI